MAARAFYSSLILLVIFLSLNGTPGFCQDKCPLVVTDWSPQGTIDEDRPLVSATFKSQCGADIDATSIQMLFQGSPVPHAVSGRGAEMKASYTPESDLKYDIRYNVTVRARDVQGNSAEYSWRFYLPFHY